MDCRKTEIFLKERLRMCRYFDRGCKDCPIREVSNGAANNSVYCSAFILTGFADEGEPIDFNRVINAVQKWSDENPLKTRLDELKEKFPKVQCEADGLPKEICAGILYGFECEEEGDGCEECWRAPVEDGE